MTEPLTDEQRNAIDLYSTYSDDELYNLVGNLCTELGNDEVRQGYVLGAPDVFQRGLAYARSMATRTAEIVCPSKDRLDRFIQSKQHVLEPFEWVSVLLDTGLSIKVTGGVPPLAVAMAIGRLANFSLDVLCRDFSPAPR